MNINKKEIAIEDLGLAVARAAESVSQFKEIVRERERILEASRVDLLNGTVRLGEAKKVFDEALRKLVGP